MASCDWQKIKTPQEVKALIRHNDKEQRMLTKHHSNEHINLNDTYRNESILGLTYAETCDRYANRIAELDKVPGQNKRKDRVTCVSLCIPVPEALPKDKCTAWFEDVAGIVQGFFGKDNFISGDVHYDEVHSYYSNGVLYMSREHGHYIVVPEFNGKLNAKAIQSRKSMKLLNNAIQTMTDAKYGVDFMEHGLSDVTNGKGLYSEESTSVEQLKTDSLEELENIRRRNKLDRDYINRIGAEQNAKAEEQARKDEEQAAREQALADKELEIKLNIENIKHFVRDSQEELDKQRYELKQECEKRRDDFEQEMAERYKKISMLEYNKETEKRYAQLQEASKNRQSSGTQNNKADKFTKYGYGDW